MVGISGSVAKVQLISGSHCIKGSAPPPPPNPHEKRSCFVKGEKQSCEAELPILEMWSYRKE